MSKFTEARERVEARRGVIDGKLPREAQDEPAEKFIAWIDFRDLRTILARADALETALAVIESICERRIAVGCGYDSEIHAKVHTALEDS